MADTILDQIVANRRLEVEALKQEVPVKQLQERIQQLGSPRNFRAMLSGPQVKVIAERAETDPKVFTRIHMHFVVTGRALPAQAVQRAIALSHERYCSASAMLAKTAEMTTDFELVEA